MGQKIHELAEQGVQVVVTTHSPAFINMLHLEGMAVLRKENGATRAIQLSREDLSQYCTEHGATRVTADTVLPFYAAAATEEILSGFFARQIVLVEGATEALALPVYLHQVGLDVTREGIAIIPVHGVGNLAKWWRLFTAHDIPTYVIYDNDSNDDSNGARRIDLLSTLSVSQDRLEQLLQAEDWLVEDSFAVFGIDYERTAIIYLTLCTPG